MGWKSYLWEKNIGTHQFEKFVKFLSLIYLQKIYIEIADYRGIFIFTQSVKYVFWAAKVDLVSGCQAKIPGFSTSKNLNYTNGDLLCFVDAQV